MRKLAFCMLSFLVVSTAFGTSARRDPSVFPAPEKDKNRPQPRRVKALFDDTSPQCGVLTPCEQFLPDDSGGTFSTCTRTDGCSVCNVLNDRCAVATVNASCKCTDDPVPGAGPGITKCHESGQCTYSHVP